MSETSAHKTIRFVDYKDEIRIRMEMYPSHSDLLEVFLHAVEARKEEFQKAAKDLELPIFDEQGNFINLKSITLIQVEDICRKMRTCGYEFLETATEDDGNKFYKFLPIRYQPYLDELFEFAFHRELETIQYCIEDFIEESHLNLEELNSIDLGEEEVSLSTAEKIAQGLYIPAFEMIKHEYILYVATKIKEYNPHRTFHRLHDLDTDDKYRILDYVRYIIQGDQVVTSGEMLFIERLFGKLEILDFDELAYKKTLFQEVAYTDLKSLSSGALDPIRRQVLGLIIDSAYADRMLTVEEGPRILDIAKLVMGDSVIE